MTILHEYALMKHQIKDLQHKCKLYEEDIKNCVKEKGTIKEVYGVFTLPIRKTYIYTKKLQKDIEKIETLKRIEELQGKAKVTEVEYLRFTPSKEAVKAVINIQPLSV